MKKVTGYKLQVYRFRSREGTSLIELLIFLGILSLVIATALPMLFAATENRILQQTIAIVEQNGTQILQNTTLRIRNAERIISPAIGQTGSVLVLQTASGATNPTIIGLNSGSIIIIERDVREVVSSTQVAIENFIVRNTSDSADNQSVTIAFDASRTIRLQQPHSYGRGFVLGVHLHPNDEPTGECGCGAPACLGNNVLQWHMCDFDLGCLSATTTMQCP